MSFQSLGDEGFLQGGALLGDLEITVSVGTLEAVVEIGEEFLLIFLGKTNFL